MGDFSLERLALQVVPGKCSEGSLYRDDSLFSEFQIPLSHIAIDSHHLADMFLLPSTHISSLYPSFVPKKSS